jgi:hypothetical protein
MLIELLRGLNTAGNLGLGLGLGVEAFSLMWDRIRADRAINRAEYCR